MALSYRARRRWALAILLIGLPVYIVAAVSLIAWLPDLPGWGLLLLYVGIGLIWVLPLKFVFRGIGQADPGAGGPERGAR